MAARTDRVAALTTWEWWRMHLLQHVHLAMAPPHRAAGPSNCHFCGLFDFVCLFFEVFG